MSNTTKLNVHNLIIYLEWFFYFEVQFMINVVFNGIMQRYFSAMALATNIKYLSLCFIEGRFQNSEL
jgi:hypothetical protein